jgi:hypothetical protein
VQGREIKRWIPVLVRIRMARLQGRLCHITLPFIIGDSKLALGQADVVALRIVAVSFLALTEDPPKLLPVWRKGVDYRTGVRSQWRPWETTNWTWGLITSMV